MNPNSVIEECLVFTLVQSIMIYPNVIGVVLHSLTSLLFLHPTIHVFKKCQFWWHFESPKKQNYIFALNIIKNQPINVMLLTRKLKVLNFQLSLEVGNGVNASKEIKEQRQL